MESLNGVRPGDIVFGPIKGAAGALVAAGQTALAAIEPGRIWKSGIKDWFRIRHVLVVTEAGRYSGPLTLRNPRAVQAMPSGAEEVALLAGNHWTKEYVYVRPGYGLPDLPGSDVWIGDAVANRARSYIGTPYNFATYAAIPAHRLHIPVPHLDRYIVSSKRMICSQLADQAMCDAGWHNFNDGRLPQDVTPFELYRALLAQPGVQVTRPGWGLVGTR